MVAVAPDALEVAVDLLLKTPGAAGLSVRSGEHLAAILLTALAGRPTAVDSDGEADLTFTRSEWPSWPFGLCDNAAVEIKSLAGDYRRTEAHLKLGDSHSTVLRTAHDILTGATGQLDRAVSQLRRKVSGDDWSRNVMLVVHLFDGLAVELFDDAPILGHLLPTVDLPADVDNLWILWHPDMLVWWSSDRECWTDLLIGTFEEAQTTSSDDFQSPLLEAEAKFLDAVGSREGSPWLFRVSPADDERAGD